MIDYTFKQIRYFEARKFIEQYHYSHSINGCKVSFCFGIYDNLELVGAMLFGQLSTTAWKKYASCEKDVLELRRLVCLDRCPFNTESWFIGKALRELKRISSAQIVVSYADPYYGHSGIIYRASNWKYHGTTASDIVLVTPDGKHYHSRAMRTTYHGQLKPFAKRLQDLFNAGQLKEVEVPGKHIFTYSLRIPQEKWKRSAL